MQVYDPLDLVKTVDVDWLEKLMVLTRVAELVRLQEHWHLAKHRKLDREHAARIDIALSHAVRYYNREIVKFCSRLGAELVEVEKANTSWLYR